MFRPETQQIQKGAYRRLFLLPLCALLLSTGLHSTGSHAQPGLCPAPGYDENATVQSVHDGDTVRLDDGRKIRLIGIDTPELARERKPEEAYAAEARERLKQLLSSSQYHVKLVYGKERKDKYQRTLAHLFLPDGQNIQSSLLEEGLATAYTHPPNDRFSACYHEVETRARCNKHGLWSLLRYSAKNSNELDQHDNGFQLIQGRVERVIESDKGIWLFLEGGLMAGIRNEERALFDTDQLKSLTGKSIRIRGWLNPKKSDNFDARFYMRLRHPSAIEVPGQTSNIPKC